MNRKRGGQPGNHNALKYGLYARSFSLAEKTSLEAERLGGFRDEIVLLRVLIIRTAKAIQTTPDMSPNEHFAALRVIAHAIGRLERLTRAQILHADELAALEDLLQDADIPPLQDSVPAGPSGQEMEAEK